MCRSAASGGRRCPSHSDPVMVANRNARRRAQYAKAKTSNPPYRQSSTFLSSHYRGFSTSELYSAKDNPIQKKVLNISVQQKTGYLVDIDYCAKTEITGAINHTKLTDSSYKTFGFKKPGRANKILLDVASELSELELKNHTPEEKAALHLFTTNDGYEWINDALYKTQSVKTEAKNEPYFVEDNLNFTPGSPKVGNMTVSESLLNETVKHLDSALKKTSGVPRIVYRGTRSNSQAYGGMETSQWIDENVSLGQEMMFDAYQSTSLRQTRGASFAGSGGILYEILTPEGVNVNSVSAFNNEAEVVLPRKSRYMCVGIHKNVKDGPSSFHVIQLIAINEKGEALNSDTSHHVDTLSDKDYIIDISSK